MRRERRYRLPEGRPKPRGGIGWLLAALALGAVVWIWWRAAHDAGSNQAGKRTSAGEDSRTPHVARQNKRPSANGMTHPPPAAKISATRLPAEQLLAAQIALDRLAISPGSLDAMPGSQTRAALLAFQRQAKLPETGELDAATRSRLLPVAPVLAGYTVTTNDLARLQPLSKTWLGKSQQSALDFETILELVAEKSHAHPDLLRRLNPDADWTNLTAGMVLRVPGVASTNAAVPVRAAYVTISLTNKVLEVFDAETNLLAHFPCSIARRVEKRPVGELHVTAVAPNPNYTFDPEVFPESPEAQQLKTRLILPPGPNNPVGTVWISLDRPGYGIHGTPNPEQVGRTESHGCFRLANWNAEKLLNLVWVGMPVYVEP